MAASRLRYIMILATGLAWGCFVQAQNVKSYFPVTNGSVQSIAVAGDTTFIGGSFTHLFQPTNTTSYSAFFNDSNERIMNTANHPDGPVYSIISDGYDGYIIGGKFNKVGDSLRQNIAHLDAEGKVTSRMNLSPDEAVRALYRNGNKVYIGGEFNLMGLRLKTSGNPIRLSDGMVNATAPSYNGDVYCSVSDGKGGWYVGGNFTKVGDSVVSNLVHIDYQGKLYNWFPKLNNAVYAIVVTGSSVIVGGAFDSTLYNTTANLCTIDAYNDFILNKIINLKVNGAVTSLAMMGNTLYAGGYFTRVGDSLRNHLVAIDLSGKGILNWNPSVDDGYVTTLAASGNTVFFGGNFNKVNGKTRNYIAAVNAINGRMLSNWNPNANNRVNKIDVFANEVYVAGNFNFIGNAERYYLASFDSTTSSANPWNPDPNGPVFELIRQGPSLFAGGGFTIIGGKPRNYVAELQLVDGLATSWDPNPDGTVYALGVSSNQVFAGGSFKKIGGKIRNYLAKYDLFKDSIDEYWRPSINGSVLAIEGDPFTGVLFAGGGFTNVNLLPRNHFVALSPQNGDLQSLDADFNDSVFCLHYVNGNLYVGGAFTMSNGTQRYHLASYSMSNYLLNPLRPVVNGNVYAISSYSNFILLGGEFSQIDSNTSLNIGMIDINSSNLNTNAVLSTNRRVRTLAVSGAKLTLGGDFTTVGDQYVNYLAQIDLSSMTLKKWPVYSDNSIHSVLVGNKRIVAGGDFTVAGGINRNYLAAIHSRFGDIMNWDAKVDASVKLMHAAGNVLTLSGSFGSVGGFIRKNLAAVKINDAKPLPLSLNLKNGEIMAMEGSDSNLFIGGTFDTINSFPFPFFASINPFSNTLNPWNPHFDGNVYTLKINGNDFYAGGTFTVVGAYNRQRLVKINLATSRIDSLWNPVVTGSSVNAIQVKDTIVYIGGNFTKVGTQLRSHLAAISNKTGAVKGFKSTIVSQVKGMTVSGNSLFIIGTFSIVDNQSRVYTAGYNLSTGALSTWNANANSSVNVIRSRGSLLYLGGDFSNVSGVNRLGLWVGDTSIIKCKLPVQLFATKGTSFCEGDSSKIWFSPEPGYGYKWLGYPSVLMGNDSFITVRQPSQYAVIITDSAQACTDTSQWVAISVNPLPQLQSIASGTTVHNCKGDSALLSVLYQQGCHYQWTFNNQPMTVSDSVFSMYVRDSGYYGLKVTSAQGCVSVMRGANLINHDIPTTKPIGGFTNVSPGSVYAYSTKVAEGNRTEWNILHGTILSGNGGAVITVQWSDSATAGVLSLREVNTSGCSGNATHFNVNISKESVNVIDSVFYLPPIGGQVIVPVYSNTLWSAQPKDIWTTPVPAQGNGNDNLNVLVGPNPDYLVRSSMMTVHTAGSSVRIYVYQDPATDTLSFSSDTLYAGGKTSLVQVDIIANCSWSTANPMDWVTASQDAGTGNTHLNILVNRNEGNTRYVTYTFRTPMLTRRLVIAQSKQTGLTEQGEQEMSMWPNPSSGSVWFTDIWNGGTYRITSISGQIQEEGLLQHNHLNVDHQLSPGVYVLEVNNNSSVYTQRLVIKP